MFNILEEKFVDFYKNELSKKRELKGILIF